ncbi:hypothetical protein ACO0LB_17930 [Undibacterium sp. SXout7W]|uniref:hypothetical protein n=1 Tax=Undibacterium sp. SXout7W TaxID=3413049 RepID=UPI003BF1ED41
MVTKIEAYESLKRVAEILQPLADQRGRIAVVFDPDKGWCITDDIDVLEPKMGPMAPEYRVIAYQQWFQPALAGAYETILEVRHARARQK